MDKETQETVARLASSIEEARLGLERAARRGHGDTVARYARTLASYAAEVEALVNTPENRVLS